MSSEADHPAPSPLPTDAHPAIPSPELAVRALTPRQREVLALIGQGLSTAEIARRLFRTVKTIESHRLVLGKRLGARNRVELARIAIRAGLVDLPSHPHEAAPSTPAPLQQLRRLHDAFRTPHDNALADALHVVAETSGARAAALFRRSSDGAATPVADAALPDTHAPRPVPYFAHGAEDDDIPPGELRTLTGLPGFEQSPGEQPFTPLAIPLFDRRNRRVGSLVLLFADPADIPASSDWLNLAGTAFSDELERREADDRFRRLEALVARVWGGGLGYLEVSREPVVERWSDPEAPHDLLAMVHPEDRARVRRACHGVADSMTEATVECRVLTRDGRERRVVMCCEPAPDSAGRAGWILGAMRDLPPGDQG